MAVCETCPVRPDCALFHARHQCEGIWGGSVQRQTWHAPGVTQGRRPHDTTLLAQARRRERVVMRLAGEGLSSTQIAAHVDIDPASVRKIIRRVRAREAVS